ncbi:cation-transporting P-type ATPase [Skermanella rosea]|uniref:cation-transporting P-type ATPase n=1 Tax=Skermanella rosea TaxID=1817965 RepID=UPI0019328DED|nr:cation-transporting P-type ATPase [Skermanella rosea]UEM03603.1 cation-transporting P-type ATPase [Skermanella rosea]
MTVDTRSRPNPAPVPGEPGSSDAPEAWHAVGAPEALRRLGTGEQGLSAGEAAARLGRYGPNRLTPPPRRSALMRFLVQFNNVLIYVLLAAAAMSAALGELVDAAVIVGVVVINALIGFIQEGKAEQALDAIRDMLSPNAAVIRDGTRRTIPADELVPGDLVQIASGDKVPADLRLIAARNLQIQESALTGESVPVAKSVDPVAPDAALGDRAPAAFSGTLVTMGQGTGLVVGTGDRTEIGRISTMIAGVETLTTPLLAQMAAFGRLLTVGILALAAFAFAVGVWLQGFAMDDMFMAAVGLAVAAIPEGLPAVMTITLAIGVTRMARRNAIIRRLPAVETLGAVSVICSDKTGTLTRNELTVRRVVTSGNAYDVDGIGYAPSGGFRPDGAADDSPTDSGADPVLAEIARASLLCNDASVSERDGEWRLEGDPTDGALVTLALKAGLDPARAGRDWPRIDVIPFESDHKFMATLHRGAGGARIYVKGAPERILEMASTERRPDGDAPLDAAEWHRRIEAMAEHGQRVLGIAVREAAPDQRSVEFEDVAGGLTLLGLVGLIDPPREEAIEAVKACASAGVRVKMITGDHAVTAGAIGAAFGLGGAPVLTGRDLDRLDERGWLEAARTTDIFARTTPEHKLRLVEALQADGATIAMTGDGVNDAPALKRADVGIAMGNKGTEAAKEAAAMVLADDNFASIARAVAEGRTVYDNLRKTILFLLPTNAAQAMIILAAILAGTMLPITPVQILWVNMISAVTLGLALAFEPSEPDIMRRPPRGPGEGILTGYMVWRILFVMVLLVIPAFGLFLWLESSGAPLEQARTVAVNALVVGEIFYLWNARAIMNPVLSARGILGSRPVLISIALCLALQLAFTYVPLMQDLFGTAAIAAIDWLILAGFGLATFLIVEAEKAVARRIMGRG